VGWGLGIVAIYIITSVFTELLVFMAQGKTQVTSESLKAQFGLIACIEIVVAGTIGLATIALIVRVRSGEPLAHHLALNQRPHRGV